jgi:inner membrane protein
MSDVTGTSPADPQRAEPVEAPSANAKLLSKIGLIGAIAFVTVLPSMFITDLAEQREARQEGVRQEFKRNWGPEQNLHSPLLVIPYQTGENRREYVEIAPARFDLAANLAPQERKRGVFHATVYDAKVDMEGTFVIPPEARLRDFVSDKSGRFLWGESAIAFGTRTSLTGLRAADRVTVNGVETQWMPCQEVMRQEQACRGPSLVLANAPVNPSLTESTRVAFKGSVSLRGTSSFAVQFSGKEMAAKFTSTWGSPSFNGDVLPLNSSVSADGFESTWQVAEFGSPRITSASTIMHSLATKGPTIGVDLIEATPTYRMINRVAKYGLLFVVLAFATYFFFEVLARLQIHIVQYGLLALSLSLFSLLLLSLAESIGYTAAYLVSAAMVLAQSTLYTAAVGRRAMPALVFGAMLASVFAFLYVLLGLETYSLLIGALALFVVVSALMILTQAMQWPAKWQPSQASA